MSLLPQRKKSPEEIAQLRESLGIPTAPLGEHPAAPPLGAPPGPAAELADPPPPQAAEMPVSAPPARSGPKAVRSLKRSEQIALLEEAPALEPVEEPAVHVLSFKPVRSLRKSEQLAAPSAPRHAPAPADSSLPYHRHSDDEINEIRRREALAMLAPPVVNRKLIPAHPVLIVLGYVAVLAGAAVTSLDQPVTTAPGAVAWIHFLGHALRMDLRPLTLPASCVALGLLVAAVIVLFRPFSRHHAAFISVITLFVIIFGALHYFPQLRHGT